MQTVSRSGLSNHLARKLASLVAMLIIFAAPVQAGSIERFTGVFSGELEIKINGEMVRRDIRVEIEEKAPGFVVRWETTTHRSDGSANTKPYVVTFQPSQRAGIYSAAMRTNVFGQAVPLDPMHGEPYVWGRIIDDTLTVFSLFVTDDGGYVMQQFDRTLTEGGLTLDFKSVGNGRVERESSTFLKRE